MIFGKWTGVRANQNTPKLADQDRTDLDRASRALEIMDRAVAAAKPIRDPYIWIPTDRFDYD